MCHKENFNAVQEAIKIAAAEVNRKPREISLVSVSKTQTIDKIEIDLKKWLKKFKT